MDMVEEQILAHFASKIRDAYRKQREFERELNKLCESHEETAVLRSVYGPKLACAIMGWLGSVYAYKTAAQLEKSCGLNLKIRQSGKVANGLHLTKRGPSIVRKYLWFAAMRVIHPDQGDAIARAWYHKRLRLNGGNKRKALVALMRKLARAIFYVGRGEGFDATKLFDVRILQLEKNGVSV